MSNAQMISKIDKQLQRAMALLRDGDRAPYFLRGAGTFFANQNTPVQIAFSVPAEGDFWGDALSVYLEVRNVEEGEKTFRSCDWTYTNDVPVVGLDVESLTDLGSVSGSFDLLCPESYSNQATSSSALFSARHGKRAGGTTRVTSFCSKLEFFVPLFIPRGNTVTLVFTPGYSKTAEGKNLEYRISALLEGFKKVRALTGVV